MSLERITDGDQDTAADISLAGFIPEELARRLRQQILRGKDGDNPYLSFVEDRSYANFPEALARFKLGISFHERGDKLQVLRDVIGLVRHLPGGEVETYEAKLKNEEKKGESEAASYGVGKIDGEEFVLYANHYPFFAGSLGVVAGQKFMEAAELANKKKVPFIAWFSSGGVRQQENLPGLLQMTRMVSAIQEYRAATNMPYISILAQQVWGGISASGVPLGDITLALAGTDYGFTGRRVIETFTHAKVPEGAQSAEVHILLRNIDLLLPEEQLLPWLRRLFQVIKHPSRLTSAHTQLPPVKDLGRVYQQEFPEGFFIPTDKAMVSRIPETEVSTTVQTKYENFLSLLKDPKRPDTETFLWQGFENVIPLYNIRIKDGLIMYPSIVAGLGIIGDRRYLVVGNQPSYQRRENGKVLKIPASPTPADFRYMQRMLRWGERLGLPAIFLTDTPGAKPTLKAEFDGQCEAIATSIDAGISYKRPVISIITGILGSGGGLATTPFGDRVAMLEHAMAFVAEPSSATSILLNKPDPTVEEVERTINTIRATAEDQLNLGLIDDIIPERQDSEATSTRFTVEQVRNYVYQQTVALEAMSTKKRLQRRRKRIKNLKGIPLKRG